MAITELRLRAGLLEKEANLFKPLNTLVAAEVIGVRTLFDNPDHGPGIRALLRVCVKEAVDPCKRFVVLGVLTRMLFASLQHGQSVTDCSLIPLGLKVDLGCMSLSSRKRFHSINLSPFSTVVISRKTTPSDHISLAQLREPP